MKCLRFNSTKIPGFTFVFAMVLSILLFNSFAKAQVSASFRNTNMLTLKPEDIFNVMINDLNPGEMKIYAEGIISDAQGNSLVHLKTDLFLIHQGVNIVSPASLNVINVLYTNNIVKETVLKTGAMPPGSYNYCVNLIRYEGAVLCKACGEINLIISPPELISPFNTEHIPVQIPLLTWHGPGPLSPEMISMLTYQLKIVELYDNEPPISAISNNPAIYYGTDIPHEFLEYGPENHELEKGKTYAWQVSAYSGTYFLGKSEVWTFTIDTLAGTEKPKEKASYYTVLKSTFDGSYIDFTNIVRFKFDGYYSFKSHPVCIFSSRHENLAPADLKIEPHYGDNRFAIDLTPYPQFKNNELYTIVITTDRGEILTMGFKYLIDKKIHETKNSSTFIHPER